MTINQQPAKKAYCRAPVLYLINDTDFALAGAQFEAWVYMWDGDITADKPTEPNYKLKKLPDRTGNAIFDTHNLLKGFFGDFPLDISAGLNNSNFVYNTQVEFYFSSDSTPQELRQTSSTIQFVYGYSYYLDKVNWENPIRTGQSGRDDFVERIIQDGGLIEAQSCIPQMLLTELEDGFMTDRPTKSCIAPNTNMSIGGIWNDGAAMDTIYIENDLGQSTSYDLSTISPVTDAEDTLWQLPIGSDQFEAWKFSADTKWYYVVGTDGTTEITHRYYFEICEPCKWGYLNLAFINRYGVWDYVQFYGRQDESYNVTSGEHMRSGARQFSNQIQYLENGQFIRNNISGRTTVSCNTGFVKEETSEVVKQLLLSDTVRDANTNEPYTIETSQETYKLHRNEKLINYTLSVKKAYSIINTVM